MTEEVNVVLGLSGGVDSSVTALLLQRAIGRQLTCIFVDNGLLRKGEAERVRGFFRKHFKMNLRFVSARRQFLSRLKGVAYPKKKRKIIGRAFIEAFENEAGKLQGVEFLAQGTLYPDVVESRSAFGGPSAVIKSHHNVGGLPKKMKLKLIEPLKHLFKDEVRIFGKELGLLEDLIWRQPYGRRFPAACCRESSILMASIIKMKFPHQQGSVSIIWHAQTGAAKIARSAIEVNLLELDTNASEEDYLQLFLLTGNKLSYIKSNP